MIDTTLLIIILAGIIVLIMLLLLWSLRATASKIETLKKDQAQDKSLELMQQQIGQLTQNINQQLQNMSSQFRKTTGDIGGTLGDVKKDLGASRVQREFVEEMAVEERLSSAGRADDLRVSIEGCLSRDSPVPANPPRSRALDPPTSISASIRSTCGRL